MTTLGSLVKAAALPLDLGSLVASLSHAPGADQLAPGPVSLLAALEAWTHQDDDAHEPCSLVACRTPLHPGPCKGWKGTLHSVSPHIWKQVEQERVDKANARRTKRIADLKAQGKPIPRKLLTEIKPKPAPGSGASGSHPANNATATPLGKVNQQADLTGGQAHTAGQAINKAAGITPNTAKLPTGPKGKKPTVAGRGPAFVITQPKVTDTYKLDKASKITPAEWAALPSADKKAIRDELEAIKQRGFGPQQTKATALLAQLPMTATLGNGNGPTVKAPGVPTANSGKVTLGRATKSVPTTTGRGAAAAKPAAADAADKAADGTVSSSDVIKAVDKIGPGALNPVQRDAIKARLSFIASHPGATDGQKKGALAQMKRLGMTPAAAPAAPAPSSTPNAPSATESVRQAGAALAITEALHGAQKADAAKLASALDQMKAAGDLKQNPKFRLLVDRLAQGALKQANASNMPGIGHGTNDAGITEFNHQIRDHIADGKPGLPPLVQKLVDHKAGNNKGAPGTPSPSTPAAPAPSPVSKTPDAGTRTIGIPRTATTPTPAKPTTGVPKVLSPDAQTARAVAGRGVGGRPTAKLHLDTYSKLSKDDFDNLDATTQKTIRDDLANASAKFLDPKKKQDARNLLDRFGSKHPAPAAPAAPAPHPKGYSDPQDQAVKLAASGTASTDDVLKSVARLTPKQVQDLDDGDRKAVLTRLAFVATHPKATDTQKAQAAAYGRIVNSGPYATPPSVPGQTPSLGELHRHEEATGAANIAAVKTIASISKAGHRVLSTDATDVAKKLGSLSKQQFATLPADDQKDILDALQKLHDERVRFGGKITVDEEVGKAITAYTGKHLSVYRLETAEADFKAGKITGDALHGQYVSAIAGAPGNGTPADKAARDIVEAAGARIARDNPTLPMYVRVQMIPSPAYGTPGYHALNLAGLAANWRDAPRMSTGDFRSLFKPTEDDLKTLDPVHAQAIRELRLSILDSGLKGRAGVGSTWSESTRNAAVGHLLGITDGGEVSSDRMTLFHSLPTSTQQLVREAMQVRLVSQRNDHDKVDVWVALRQLEGKPPLQGEVRDAVLKAVDRFSTVGKMDAYRRLAPNDFADLPSFAQNAITGDLRDLHQRAVAGPSVAWAPGDNALKLFPAALSAHLMGIRPVVLSREARNVTDIVNYGRDIITPQSRTETYGNLSLAQLRDLSPLTSKDMFDDLRKIENDGSLPLKTRYDAAMSGQVFLKSPSPLSAPQMTAAMASDMHPNGRYSDVNAFTAYASLDKTDYDALSPTLREAIDERIKGLPGSDQQILTAKFHPQAAAANPNPTGTVPTGTTGTPPPAHVQDALDTIYGVHPKAHTMAHQLKTYGGLRGSDFAAFNPQEQQHLLSDLSFIATTAKGPSGDKARKLIDRFTPPGTPSGQLPGNPPIIPPANAVPGQTRYAIPLKGLAKAANSGTSGDGWLSLPGGKRVWGHYGAAGLLIKHTDPGTGEERYLMVQRGPAISDPGKWTFPGGASDSLETPHEGATRETIEELGLKDDQFKDALVHGDHVFSVPGSTWKYTTVAASVPQMFKPNLSTAHARAETSDAKWMTIDEIRALDTSGKLHGPIAGGLLEKNVISLYPAGTPAGTGKLGQIARPGPVTKRLNRLTMPSGGRQSPASYNAWPHVHKPSTGKNLVADKAAIDAMRQKVKQDRAKYDGKTADGRLAAIGAMQGFDDTPTVLSKAEIDKLVASGDYIEAWRGVSGAGGGWSARSRGGAGGKTAADINEEMRSGPAYYGKGIFGNGYYLATSKRVAEQYSDHSKGSLVRVLIPKSALTKKYPEVRKEAEANSTRMSKAKGGGYDVSTFWDPGRWAAAKGLDGIEIGPNTSSQGGGGSNHVASAGKPAFNWLNRSVLILQKEPG